MPVIGRLDGQVDEVLIAPLERRRRGGDESTVDERNERAANRDDLGQRAAEDKIEKHAPRNEVGRDAARDKLREDEAAREELPVWLL